MDMTGITVIPPEALEDGVLMHYISLHITTYSHFSGFCRSCSCWRKAFVGTLGHDLMLYRLAMFGLHLPRVATFGGRAEKSAGRSG